MYLALDQHCWLWLCYSPISGSSSSKRGSNSSSWHCKGGSNASRSHHHLMSGHHLLLKCQCERFVKHNFGK